ncbi:MAG: hypothetical protein HKN32_05725 [Flavobacteriales bacterium]|nr:hypothetical protein [Flavobacteriales bacterium]
MRGIVLMAALLVSLGVDAQYEPRNDTLPERLNTLGINLTPAVVVSMNALPFSPRFSFIYKRQLQPNFKVRATVGYEVRSSISEDLSTGRVIDFSDTTVTYLIERANHSTLDLRLGMEWFKPNRPTTMVYGIDLIAGIAMEDDGYSTIPRYFNGDGFVPSPFEEQFDYDQEIDYFLLGFNVSIGQKLVVDEKLNFILQWTPQVAYRIPISEFYSDATQRDQPAISDVEMRLRGIEIFVNLMF